MKTRNEEDKDEEEEAWLGLALKASKKRLRAFSVGLLEFEVR